MDIFKPHLEKILARKEDSYQLCAAEMMSGIIIGSKLWPFDKAQKLIKWYVPLLRQVLDEMPVETQANWGSAIAGTLVRARHIFFSSFVATVVTRYLVIFRLIST